MYNMSCPICLKDINSEKMVGNKAYCDCGYAITLSHKGSRVDSGSKGGVLSLVLLTSLIVAAIIHAFNWDNHFFTVIPLKIKQITKTAKIADLTHLADICTDRKKLPCEANALEDVLALDPMRTEERLRVASVYNEMSLPESVITTLNEYFKKGGTDRDARLTFAKALAQVGRFKDSQKQYRYLLKTDSKNPQYQVARSYVELLMRQNDYATAKQIIQKYRKAGQNSGLFLEKEWKVINSKLGLTAMRVSTGKI